MMKRFALLLVCASLVGMPGAPALAAPDGKPSAGEMTADLVVARPVGVAVTKLGKRLGPGRGQFFAFPGTTPA